MLLLFYLRFTYAISYLDFSFLSTIHCNLQLFFIILFTYFLIFHFFLFILCRRALLAVSVSFDKTLLTVFKEKDKENDGYLSLNDFTRILVNLGSTLNSEEISFIAERYKATENYGNGRNSVSEKKGCYDGNFEESNRNLFSSGQLHTHTHKTYIHTRTHA